MSDDYLWDRSGTPDPDVAWFEHWAGQLAPEPKGAPRARRPAPLRRPAPARRSGFGVGLTLGLAAVLVLVWLVQRGMSMDETSPRRPDAAPPSQAPAVTIDRDGSAHAEAKTDRSTTVTPTATREPGAEPTPPALPPTPFEAARAAAAAQQPRPRNARRTAPPAEPEPAPAARPPTDEEGRAAVRRNIEAYGHMIAPCYAENTNAPRGAMVFMRFDVTDDGDLRNIRLERHNLMVDSEGRAVAKCLGKMLERWHFDVWNPEWPGVFVAHNPNGE